MTTITTQMSERPVTIRDVAAQAKVGTATVSRVLNKPWKVSPETTQRVKDSIEKLGYKPNFRARLLAQGNSGMMCFLLSNRPFAHSVHGQVLQGAAKEADALGVQIVYAGCTYEPETSPCEIRLPQLLVARGFVDGVILAGTNYSNILDVIEQIGLPYVVFGTNLVISGHKVPETAVYVDEQEGSRRATEHLLSLGHTRIVFIGDIRQPWYRRRYQGYCDALCEAGLKPLPAVGEDGSDTVRMGVDATIELLREGVKFTAVVAGSDRVAHGAMRVLKEYGLRIPHDVSVVGFDDDEIASLEDPPLTTVRMPAEEVGARCIRMLHSIVRRGEKPNQAVWLPVELVIRKSASTVRSSG